MAVPKRKHSKARTRRRRNIKGKPTIPTLVVSQQSGEVVRRHRVDMKSGYYRGRKIFDPEDLG